MAIQPQDMLIENEAPLLTDLCVNLKPTVSLTCLIENIQEGCLKACLIRIFNLVLSTLHKRAHFILFFCLPFTINYDVNTDPMCTNKDESKMLNFFLSAQK